MNRRDFIKSLSLVAAGSTATIVPVALLKEAQPIEPIKFDKATLQRWTNGRWHLNFEAEEVFNPSGKNDIVVELAEFKFLLKNMGKIEHSWEFEGNYIHWVSGDGWEEVTNDKW